MIRKSLSNTVLLIPLLACSGVALALQSDQFEREQPLLELELESLMDLSISSLSKHEEQVSKAAAAVFVLTSKDIERAPVTNLIEALRLIPGVNVARINSTTSQVSIRGFNNTFAWNLLVLVDGRSIYSPLYSGVFWEQNHIPLALIDRIEVVRGPGGAIWGANAVNGVINIITKSSQLDQGVRVSAYAGSQEQLVDVKYGGVIAGDPVNNGTWRAYVNYHQHDAWSDWPDTSAKVGRLGLRWDGVLASNVNWSVMLDHFRTDTRQVHRIFNGGTSATVQEVDVDIDGYTLNARLGDQADDGNDWTLQWLSEYYERDLLPQSRVRQSIHELNYQYRFKFDHSALTLGASYRGYHDRYDRTLTFYLNPDSEYNYFYSLFVQHKWRFWDERMELALGSKFEEHRFQGGFNQPTARYAWQINASNTVWAAYSNAVQAGGRVQRGVHWKLVNDPEFNPSEFGVEGLPTAVAIHELNGEDGAMVEAHMDAWEVGYRAVLRPGLYVDLSAYYHEYDDIYLLPPLQIDFIDNDYYFVTQTFAETGQGWSNGVDLALTWTLPAVDWRLALSYYTLDLRYKQGYPTIDLGLGQEKADPRWQASVEHNWQFLPRWYLNTFVRYVHEIPFFDVFRTVEGYTTVDAKLGYQPRPDVMLYLVGKNLFDPRHYEGRIIGGIPREEEEVLRSWMLGLRWTW